MDRYLPLDEEGYFVFDGRRVDDEALGQQLLTNLKVDGHSLTTALNGQPAWVEAFDAPLIVKHVAADGTLELPYHTQMRCDWNTLSVDEWDRFHGLTTNTVPFVFSRQAQVEFFDLLDEFDDESVTLRGRKYPVPAWLIPTEAANASGFWTEIYQGPEKPGWDLGHESQILPAVLPKLKLSKCRVLVLGSGRGHDAAYFAQQGHVVTAVDFSAAAVEKTREQYGHLPNFSIEMADAFHLPPRFDSAFDLIFEHTCYCAVSPERRNELVKVWKKALTPRGELLGVFFANERRQGPPFGGSEWELRERFKAHFDFLMWSRWRQSEEWRKGQELVLYARLKER